MRYALSEAEKSIETGDFPIGAVLVHENTVIAKARNTGYTDKNRLAHAEIKLLSENQAFLETHKGEVTLYTTYEPCPMCFGAMVLMKLKRVVTGTNIDHSGSLQLQDSLSPFWQQEKFRFEITTGVLFDECRAVFLRGKMGGEYVKYSKNS